MFVGEARSLPLSGASERFFLVIYSRIGSGLSPKHNKRWNGLPVTEKHSSLLQILVNYGHVITLCPGQ